MLDFLLDGIFDGLFRNLIIGFFKLVRMLGIAILQGLYFYKHPYKEMSIKFKDSSIPYFLGFGLITGFIALINTLS